MQLLQPPERPFTPGSPGGPAGARAEGSDGCDGLNKMLGLQRLKYGLRMEFSDGLMMV